MQMSTIKFILQIFSVLGSFARIGLTAIDNGEKKKLLEMAGFDSVNELYEEE